ncbi:MAG: beta-ketoacyl-[acyl-carrier-protein] synthase family protein [Verrucomicrobia bacterium]|nr:beta-ketoacyl-[acyl-carrier-protein] synthase family protein [Verrucomicrobiota bacterium]
MLFPRSKNVSTARRVVVTGCGMVTPLGLGMEANAEGFRSGRTAFRSVSLFDVSRQRVRTAAEVDLPPGLPVASLTPRQTRLLDRAGTMLLWAAHEATQQARWNTEPEARFVVGTTGGGMSLGETYYRAAIHEPQVRRQQPTRSIGYQAYRQTTLVAKACGVLGSVNVIANACASGANAIGHAWELVRSGRAERALAAGYDSICQMILAGFDSLQALSPTQCRPFDAQRDGLALGEGAAALTLETLEAAQARGATILAELVGYGAATDVHHLTQPHPQGAAAVATMTEACRSAGLEPRDIDYVNAHGTGTPLNDSAEAVAITRWAGARTATLPVSSTKAGIGHLLGAAGAVEAAICVLALRGQWLPPMPATRTPDPACGFPLVTQPASARLTHVMTNSFGFGGANATLLFRRWE